MIESLFDFGWILNFNFDLSSLSWNPAEGIEDKLNQIKDNLNNSAKELNDSLDDVKDSLNDYQTTREENQRKEMIWKIIRNILLGLFALSLCYAAYKENKKRKFEKDTKNETKIETSEESDIEKQSEN